MAVAKDLYTDQQTAVDPQSPESNEQFTAAKANAIRDKIYELIDELLLYSLDGHNHDSRYFTETEINAFFEGEASGKKQVHWDRVTNKPSTFAPSTHDHDDRYYTETELDNLFEGESSGKKQIDWLNVVNKPYINLLEFDPTADGVADDTTPFDDAQEAADLVGGTVYVPTGTYRIVGKTNSDYTFLPAGRAMYIFYVSFYFEKGVTIIYENGGADDRGFVIMPQASPLRSQRIGISATDGATRMELTPQAAGLNTVSATSGNESDAGDFNPGEYVHISCGVNPYDADDPLWRNDMIAKVIDANGTSGVVTLDRNIPFALKDDGYDGTTPTTYATSYSATAGERFLNGGLLYEALVSGTTDAADPEDDGYHDDPTIDVAGDGYVQDEVTVKALEPVNGFYIDLGEVFDVTVTAGAITDVSPTLGVGGYTSNCVLIVISDNDTATTPAELSANILGVAFKKLANDNGSVEDDRNGAPIIQKIIDPVVDVTINGNGAIFEFESEVQSMLALRNCLNCSFENIKVTGTCEFPIGAAEGATDVVYKNIDALDILEHTTGDPSKSRIFSGYNVHSIKLIDIKGICGSDDSDAQAIRIESFSNVEVIGGEYNNRFPLSTNSYGVFFDPGTLTRLEGALFKNFRQPYRYNTSVTSGFILDERDRTRPPISNVGHISGNTFLCSAQGFRAGGVHPDKLFREGERYILSELYNSGDIQHPENVDFTVWKRVVLWRDFDVLSGSTGTWFPMPREVFAGDRIINLRRAKYIILGQEVHWDLPPENSQLSVRISTLKGATRRSPFHSAINSQVDSVIIGKDPNSMSTDSMSGVVGLFDPTGSGIRYIDGREESIEMLFSLKGSEGGIGHIMLDMLISEPYGE